MIQLLVSNQVFFCYFFFLCLPPDCVISGLEHGAVRIDHKQGAKRKRVGGRRN